MTDRSKIHVVHGGHRGAEAAFGEMAGRWGLGETTISYDGHKMERSVNVEELKDEQLEKGHVSMEFVFQRMGRRFVRGHGHRRVIYSMFHVVTRGDTVFAIGWIQPDNTVKGGTGWGVELAKLFNRPIYVYDQERNGWFTWGHEEWTIGDPRLPEKGTIAATGTRNLTDAGHAAIEALFRDSLGEP